jgi:hypothetical protein
VIEGLPKKHEALSLIPSTEKTNKQTNKKLYHYPRLWEKLCIFVYVHFFSKERVYLELSLKLSVETVIFLKKSRTYLLLHSPGMICLIVKLGVGDCWSQL